MNPLWWWWTWWLFPWHSTNLHSSVETIRKRVSAAYRVEYVKDRGDTQHCIGKGAAVLGPLSYLVMLVRITAKYSFKTINIFFCCNGSICQEWALPGELVLEDWGRRTCPVSPTLTTPSPKFQQKMLRFFKFIFLIFNFLVAKLPSPTVMQFNSSGSILFCSCISMQFNISVHVFQCSISRPTATNPQQIFGGDEAIRQKRGCARRTCA